MLYRSEFVVYANTLVELLQSFAQDSHSHSALQKLVEHIYKHRSVTMKHYARSLLAVFPKGDRLAALDLHKEQWSPLRIELSEKLASIVRRLYEDQQLPPLTFEEPNLMVLREETLASPLLLIYEIVTAIMQGRGSLQRGADFPEELHVHNSCVMLKEVIGVVPSRYWQLEAVGDYVHDCYAFHEDGPSRLSSDCLAGGANTFRPQDVYLNDTDRDFPVKESPDDVYPAVHSFLKGIAAIYQYEVARCRLSGHPLCKRNAPIKLTCIEVEHQDFVKPSPELLRLLIPSIPPQSIPGLEIEKRLGSVESGAYAPHCAAGAMAAFAYFRSKTGAQWMSNSSPPESFRSFFSTLAPSTNFAQDDLVLTIGTSKKCCSTCALLCEVLEVEFDVDFKVALGHANWSPWWPPSWLPDRLLADMVLRLHLTLRVIQFNTDDSSDTGGDSSSPDSPTEEGWNRKFIDLNVHDDLGSAKLDADPELDLP
ncbi:hypothetical protein E1B28_011325 [Marasmius oreades]|uniref:Uncharacterized protein n=1 Tax=Marasmius oreades TaxID=181124 RepID=A0A9P7RUL2_9AGAR|nr:uncharacterized protein E1B28_011325 [Marasmius oreades]KAG7089665.1 hypothetical protein E1B28_011325 [Marasmius oreades]